MNLKWNLTDLFENNESFYKEIENIKLIIVDIKKFADEILDENLLFTMLDEKWKIKELANNILIYGSLMYYRNIKSPECIELKKTAEDFYNKVDLEICFIDEKILNLGKEKIEDFINKNSKLKVYKLSLDNLFRMQEHVPDEIINSKIKDNINAINMQLNLYNDKLRDIKYDEIEVDGKPLQINSSNIAKYLSARNRNVRMQTYLAVNNTFKDLQDEFANILDSIFNFRIENARLENYSSVLEKVLFEENIDSNIIKTLIDSVNNNLKLMQRYLKIKSELLEIDDPHIYDFGVSLCSNLNIKYSYEEAIAIIKNALKPLGSEYLKAVDFLLEGHFDAIPDDNKHQSITFSWNTYSFMNYRGSYTDLKNMIHELGHIVNYYFSKKNLPFIYEDSTIFVGETASIVNEILLNKYLYENAKTEEEKTFYLSKEIENYFTSVFKQTMYTEFEQALYKEKFSHNLTPNLLSEIYEKLIRKYYGNDISYDDVANVEWSRLGHLYRWSYYSYKYATGLIMASVVVNSLINDHSLSKEKYIEFLSSGSSMYSLDLLKTINIDLMDSRIINNGFKILEKDIDELDKTLKKTNVKHSF